VRGNWADTSGYIVRVDNSATFSKSWPFPGRENKLVDGSQTMERAKIGVHYESSFSPPNVIVRWRKPDKWALLYFSSKEAARTAYEAVMSGRWIIPLIDGGLLPKTKVPSQDRPERLFLGSLPKNITKADLISLIPPPEDHPNSITLSNIKLCGHKTPIAMITAMCKQIGPVLKVYHEPERANSNTRNMYAVIKYERTHGTTASKLLDGMHLPLGQKMVLHCNVLWKENFRISPALLSIAKEELAAKSIGWGEKGLKVKISKDTDFFHRKTCLGGKPFLNLNIWGSKAAEAAAAKQEIDQILRNTLVPIEVDPSRIDNDNKQTMRTYSKRR
jgi:hypothetical protein